MIPPLAGSRPSPVVEPGGTSERHAEPWSEAGFVDRAQPPADWTGGASEMQLHPDGVQGLQPVGVSPVENFGITL